MGSQRATRPRRGPGGVTEEVTAREEETQKTTDAAVETQETATRPGNTHELSDRELNGDCACGSIVKSRRSHNHHRSPRQ
ncbi:hypothetical protein PR003_g15528 [Phytophthora rubi]|uniref:Uncharacterized protein n=1 Tax=Phytophthora rubi TaxID=129364 RepID=A0A6A4EP82_9STRA|nr:hypothetical protein PR002_g15167 [Phytophthora rubi]KAE9329546.1 hypothetical protein PR003_g15528 [Phytophthora rubi]